MSLHIYGIKEYDNDILIHDYVPCKQSNATGDYYEVTGFYDAIDNVFYNVYEFAEVFKEYKNAAWTWK